MSDRPWTPTVELRFEYRRWYDSGHAMAADILQQKWVRQEFDSEGGHTAAVEWRDVPVVREER